MATLQNRLDRLAAALPGTFGLAVHVLKTGEQFQINAGELFPLASVFKVPLLVRLFHLVDAGEIRLTDMVELRAEDKSPGSGVLKEFLPGARVSVRDLAMLMTIVSDNTATDILYGMVGGGDAITAAMRRLAIDHVAVTMDCKMLLQIAAGTHGTGYGPAAQAETVERLRHARFDYTGLAFESSLRANCATPAAMAALLALIERREAASPDSCDQMLDMLRRQQLNDRIPMLLPRPFKVAHKTGTLGTTRNDAGVIYLPNGDPIVFCAFDKDVSPADWQAGDRCIAEAAQAVYAAYA